MIANCKIYNCKEGQFVVMFINVRMFNVINNRPRFTKHIQQKFFGGLDIIITCDFYQTSLMKDSLIFQNIKG